MSLTKCSLVAIAAVLGAAALLNARDAYSCALVAETTVLELEEVTVDGKRVEDLSAWSGTRVELFGSTQERLIGADAGAFLYYSRMP